MKISIITTFYDKDHENIPNMLKHLEKLTVDKEVIFVDDRNDKSEDIRAKYNVPEEYKIVPSNEAGENVGTFEARRAGTMAATSDYVWYIDIDDQPLNIDTDRFETPNEEEPDLICCEYLIDDRLPNGLAKKNDVNEHQNDRSMKHHDKHFADIVHLHDDEERKFIFKHYRLNYTLWKNLYKRSTLMDIYSSIPTHKNFKVYEDIYLNGLVIQAAKSVLKSDQYIYNYHVSHKYFPDQYRENMLQVIDWSTGIVKDLLKDELRDKDVHVKGLVEIMAEQNRNGVKPNVRRNIR